MICKVLSKWSDFRRKHSAESCRPGQSMNWQKWHVALWSRRARTRSREEKKVNPYLDLDLHMPFFTRLSLSLDKELNLVVVIIFIYSTSWHSACSGGKNLFKVGSIFQIKINYLYKYSYEHCNSITHIHHRSLIILS